MPLDSFRPFPSLPGVLLPTLLAVSLSAGAAFGQASPTTSRAAEPPPTIGDGDARLYEKSAKAAQTALAYYDRVDDREAAERVQEIGYRLAAQLEYDDFPFSFYLIDMPVPNAFALPGGHVFVTRGMLDLGLDDDMLANLLGHEIAHVVYEHGTKMQRRATLLNLLSQAALLGVMVGVEDTGNASRSPGPYDGYGGGSRKGSLVQGAAASGLVFSELLLRDFSRGFEDEADVEGQRLAAAAGFDPDGARALWQLMIERIPTNEDYGYWRTHPFSEQRLRAAEVRARDLRIAKPEPADAYRAATQRAILAYSDALPPRERPLSETRPDERPTDGSDDDRRTRRPPPPRPGAVDVLEPDPPADWERELVYFLEMSALDAWPRGPRAEAIREAQLERLRRRELAEPPLQRDYGMLLAAHRDVIETVESIDPDSSLLARLRSETATLRAASDAIYPEAIAVWKEGVVQTPFLITFLSNYPDSEVAPDVALALGEAYSRMGRQSDAVEHFLLAYDADPAGEAAEKALRGLRTLTPRLDELVALHRLESGGDAELRRLASSRLEQQSSSYERLETGADYLRRFPEGPHADAVEKRLEALAKNLYGEVVLYQGLGDHVQALERIQAILEHAPTTAAAKALRERAELDAT